MVVEVGDFERFGKPEKFAAFLGLVLSEDASGERLNRYSIAKAGNCHLRQLLVEVAQAYTRSAIGHKSIVLKQRQAGKGLQIIAYADKANERLRRRFYKMKLNKCVNKNAATTAIARESACMVIRPNVRWTMSDIHLTRNTNDWNIGTGSKKTF